MAKRWKYDLAIKEESGNKIFIYTDYDLHEIDKKCSSYDSEIDFIIELSKKMQLNPKSKIIIIDDQGNTYNDPIFGNKYLKIAGHNIYKGLDSNYRERKMIKASSELSYVIGKFLEVLRTKEGEAFCETTDSFCVPREFMNLNKKYVELQKKNEQYGGFYSEEEALEFQRIERIIKTESYIYKNFRAMIAFIDRFNKRKNYGNYNRRNVQRNDQRGEVIPTENVAPAPQINWKEEADKYNKTCAIEYDREEYLDADEYAMMVNEDNVDANGKQYKKR